MKHVFLWLSLAALCLLPVHTADGAEQITLDTVIERWTDALGGQQVLAATEVVHLTYRVKIMGLDGTLHEWAAADGRHHLELDLAGLFRIVMVSDGVAGWMRDQNGMIQRLAGMELKNEITAAYMATYSYLLEDRMPGTLDYLGTEDVTGYHIIKASPEGGIAVTVYLDPQTYLPVRTEQPEQERTLTGVPSQWKTFGGVLVATEIVQSSGDPQYDQVFELADADFQATPTSVIFQKPVDEAQDFTFAQGNSAREIPFELNFVHIFLQARVNGSDPLWFLLDTGASVSVLNTTTAKALGLGLEGKIEGRGAGEGSIEANLIANVTFELPGVTISGQTAAAIPFDKLEPIMGRPLDGIFGYDMISRFVVEIDYQNKRLHLYDRESYAYEGDGARVPLQIEGGSPHVTASVTTVDGRTLEGRFLVDTGAALALDFTRPFTAENDLLASLPDKFLFEGGYGVGGESKRYVGRVQSIQMGGLTFLKPVCGFSQDRAGAGADPNRAGLIGGEILARCTVVFDYERGEMILEPNSDFEDPYNTTMAGLILTTGGRDDLQTMTVKKVMPDTPAAEAGFEPGDVIESIDGRKAAEFTVHELYEYFKREGETVRLVILRDGKSVEKSIRLTKLI